MDVALRRAGILLAAVVVTACSTESTPTNTAKATLVIVASGDADVLFPPLAGTTTARQVVELVYDYLAESDPGSPQEYKPALAESWQWSPDSLALSVRIRNNARWHDTKPVRASDVRFTFDLYTNPRMGSSTGSQLVNIDSVSVADSVTAVFWFRKRYPLQFYDAATQMQILPRHIFGRIPVDSLRKIVANVKPVGSGRYRFDNWKRNESIELESDTTNYRGAPGTARLIWRITPSAVTATRMLFAGEADIYDTMRPENVREAESHPDVRVVMTPGSDYVFMSFNMRDPSNRNRAHRLFASRDLRRALSMAVNRAAIVRNVFDSLARPAIGPTITAFPSTDTTLRQLPFSIDESNRILDSLGWMRDRQSGMRAKNGRPLAFKLLVPASSLNRKRMAVLIQEQLRKAGVAVELDEMEYSTFNSRMFAREFDASLWNWHLGTSATAVKETWTSTAAKRDGYNLGSYINPDFDALVDSATSTFDPEKRRQYYTKAYQLAIDDAPAIWLYEPKTVLGIHKRIRTGPMRPDAWWFSLADWHVPPAEQIARDRSR